MEMQIEIEKTLQAASAVLERRQKIEAAISHEVAGLSELIAARLEAERELRIAEGRRSLGEPVPSPAKIEKSAEAARAALEQACQRLSAFRMNLAGQGGDLVQVFDELAGAIPQRDAAAVRAFSEEWRAAAAAWSELLGRRQAIEKMLNRELELPNPSPVPIELGDMARPRAILAELRSAIEGIANMKSIAEHQAETPTYYNPSGVYKITHSRWGAPAQGSLVVDATFESGRLRWHVEHGNAQPVQDCDFVPGLEVASTKARQLETAAREAEYANSERRLHVLVPESEKRSTLIYDSQFEPTQADLDRTAERQRMIDEHSIAR